MSTSIEQLIRGKYEGLSRTLRRTASWILSNPAHVATRPLEQLAELSGQSSASFIRLAQILGYPGWSGLRDGFAELLRDGQGGVMFAARLGAASMMSPPPAALHTELGNLQRSYTPANAAVIAEAIEHMAQARRIALVSRRSCSAPMTWLYYLLRITSTGVILADDRGGAFGLDLLEIGPKDVVIAASFVPCSHDTVIATRMARESGAWTLGIVDSPLGALARTTDQHLLVSKASDAFFDSMVGAMAVVQWLASAWVASRGQDAIACATRYQHMMVATGAFDPGDPGPSTLSILPTTSA